MNKDFYDDMMETFLDEVFENEALLKQEEWIELVAEKQSYLFDPKMGSLTKACVTVKMIVY